jgi:transposase InsO family protein
MPRINLAAVARCSSVGDCCGNAPMKSIFGSTKTEFDDGQRVGLLQMVKNVVFALIEGFYNRRRLHSATGNRSPANRDLIAAAA